MYAEYTALYFNVDDFDNHNLEANINDVRTEHNQYIFEN